jgi:FkbM family methyltransferase
VPDDVLISYAQNGEDIVLWRTLGHLPAGIYVDVGAWDPDADSVTRIFYERGWRGLDIEPVPEFAARFRERRPGNEVVQAIITDEPAGPAVLHRFGDTGLSTVDDAVADRHDRAGLSHEDITVPARRLDDVLADSALVDETVHFLKIDVEGAEANVLRSIDLSRWRPWVVVVEATEPNSTTRTHGSWEPILLAAGYTFTLFDGLSRFYASPEHPELVDRLSYPACPLDEFQKAREVELNVKVPALEEELETARAEAARWREAATEAEAGTASASEQLGRVRQRLRRVRAQRQQLRKQVGRLRERNRRLRVRNERMSRRIEQMKQRERSSSGSVRGRLGAVARKALGRRRH